MTQKNIIYRSWTPDSGAIISEVDYDYDVHAFRIEYKGFQIQVVPSSFENMTKYIKALDSGGCPLRDVEEFILYTR